MSVVFLLAHFDDEYCALPLILEVLAAGQACWFLYVADYRDPANAAVRLAETRAFLNRFGVPAERILHVGAGSGVMNGRVCEGILPSLARLRAALARVGPVGRLVTPAWEGGHPDHDSCAAMASILGKELNATVLQFGLYNGRKVMRPFYRACSPLPENGPEIGVPLKARQWLAWLAAVRFYPSETWNWLGLYPSMFLTFAERRGFAVQTLTPDRIRERPHAGRLHYEWMFKTPYARVRAAVDAALAAQRPGRARIRKKPASIST
jgi:LmbE family N-acetylglucosaminyl deacetylase